MIPIQRCRVRTSHRFPDLKRSSYSLQRSVPSIVMPEFRTARKHTCTLRSDEFEDFDGTRRIRGVSFNCPSQVPYGLLNRCLGSSKYCCECSLRTAKTLCGYKHVNKFLRSWTSRERQKKQFHPLNFVLPRQNLVRVDLPRRRKDNFTGGVSFPRVHVRKSRTSANLDVLASYGADYAGFVELTTAARDGLFRPQRHFSRHRHQFHKLLLINLSCYSRAVCA